MNRQIDLLKKIPIVEVYPCLQSEGKLTGIPHILIRSTGCVLRCQFSETDFCDSWYTSWHPDKGTFCLADIIATFNRYPHIKHAMFTGGSMSMHPEMMKDLCQLLHERDIFITFETEGSVFVEDLDIDLLSLSPKMSNSQPRVGTKTPLGREVTQKDLDKHNKFRKDYTVMNAWIHASKDYQLKPVVSDIEVDMPEIIELMEFLEIPRNKTWLMPSGSTAKELEPKRAPLMEYCWKQGFNYSDRIHIVCYGEKRGV